MSELVQQPQTIADRIDAHLEKMRHARLAYEELTALKAYRDSLPAPPPGVTRAQLEESIKTKRQAIAETDVAIDEVLAKKQVVEDLTKELDSLLFALKTTQEAREVCLADVERTARAWANDEPGIEMTPARVAKVAELQREFADSKGQFQQIKRVFASLTERFDRVQRRV